MLFRTRLQELLRAEHGSVVRVARKVGVDHAVISRIAAGLDAKPEMRRRIADALGREVEDVFPEAGAQNGRRSAS